MTTLRERFMRHVDDGSDSECWSWTGGKKPAGYGVFYDRDRRNECAHRVAYELFVGPIPDGLEIDHLCRNRGCVNPAHLEPVTHRENLLRGDTFAARQAAQTHCKRGHPFTGENLYVSPRGKRHCRTCERAWEGQRQHRRRMAA